MNDETLRDLVVNVPLFAVYCLVGWTDGHWSKRLLIPVLYPFAVVLCYAGYINYWMSQK